MVDAALTGFDSGEIITWPSLSDHAAWTDYDRAGAMLFEASQTGAPAPRYRR